MTENRRIALVTGATRGIGNAIAKNLAMNGFVVIGTATSENGVLSIQSELDALGSEHLAARLNITEDGSIDALLKNIKEKYGKSPEVLINNAGITRDNLFLRIKESEWDDVILTNLKGVFTLTKACIKSMVKARWGRVITIGSIVGTTGNPGQTNYAAAKAGVVGFSKSLAQELGSRGITVNVVAPGFIETEMTQNLPENVKDTMLRNIPLGRFGQVEEVANMVHFLASEQASYVTGSTLHVNGGLHME
ncbi:MAG: 3-oxoacyl-ACP reductase FabG [Pseudomonadota bacterium]